MRQNRTVQTLAAFFLAWSVCTVSGAHGMDGTGTSPGFRGHVSSPGFANYESFLQDADEPDLMPPSPGFEGHLEDRTPPSWSTTKNDRESMLHKGMACGGCYGHGCGSCYTRLWVSADYIMLWSKGRYLPPLVSTGTPGENGVIGTDSYQALYGDRDVGEDFRSSGRLSLGLWLDRYERVGIGGRFLIAERDEVPFAVASNGNGQPLYARPFFNTDPVVNAQDSLIISSSGIRRGSISAQADNELMSLDAYLRVLLYEYEERRLDLIAGYQFSRIDDSLSLNHRMTQIGGAFPVGTQFAFADSFDARNTFHGATLGLQGEYSYGGLTLSMLGKLGFGNMQREVRIAGSAQVTDANGANANGNTANFNGGLLTQQTNIGTYRDDAFSFVPEVELKLLYEVSKNFEVGIGYSFIYWTEVALAGGQIDRAMQGTPTVNATQLLGGQLAGPPNPALNRIDDGGFWAQGLTFGVTLKR